MTWHMVSQQEGHLRLALQIHEGLAHICEVQMDTVGLAVCKLTRKKGKSIRVRVNGTPECGSFSSRCYSGLL